MKQLYTVIGILAGSLLFAQAGAPSSYYNGFNFSLTGNAMRDALATKVTNTHVNILSYAQAENAIRFTDLDPADFTNTNLLLVYGFSENICPASQADDNDHRRRNKNDDGGGQLCEWNREHTYPRALGTPNLESGAANADVHHLRAADVGRNGMRDNNRFTDGSGNSYETGSLWYPGDEWKGDVARMMMYMYLRYGSQCLPKNVAQNGIPTVSTDTNMVQLFLEWNAEDPVSAYEDRRNTYLGNASNNYGQGNRNPFIDNPILATVIWGGPVAENRWPGYFLSLDQPGLQHDMVLYPNPSATGTVYIETSSAIDQIIVLNLNGQVVKLLQQPTSSAGKYEVSELRAGFYLIKMVSQGQSVTRKLLVN